MELVTDYHFWILLVVVAVGASLSTRWSAWYWLVLNAVAFVWTGYTTNLLITFYCGFWVVYTTPRRAA